MTYQELLQETAKKKQEAIKRINESGGRWGKAEIERSRLAKEFLKTLADHVGEFLEQTGDICSIEAYEIGNIYMAYEDDEPYLYELLPIEAQLFEE